MDPVRVINLSLRCFTLGWLSLIPFLGVLPALLGLSCYARARNEAGVQWNPAKAYLLWGCALAWCGLALSSVILFGGELVAARNLF